MRSGDVARRDPDRPLGLSRSRSCLFLSPGLGIALSGFVASCRALDEALRIAYVDTLPVWLDELAREQMRGAGGYGAWAARSHDRDTTYDMPVWGKKRSVSNPGGLCPKEFIRRRVSGERGELPPGLAAGTRRGDLVRPPAGKSDRVGPITPHRHRITLHLAPPRGTARATSAAGAPSDADAPGTRLRSEHHPAPDLRGTVTPRYSCLCLCLAAAAQNRVAASIRVFLGT
ncbi:hypothetical protein JHW43_006267 [Diplocarpon mali]|nr:hypothetical protein JHW43_006267 [Diplocarpon mali]